MTLTLWQAEKDQVEAGWGGTWATSLCFSHPSFQLFQVWVVPLLEAWRVTGVRGWRETAALGKRRGQGRSWSCGCQVGLKNETEGVLHFLSSGSSHFSGEEDGGEFRFTVLSKVGGLPLSLEPEHGVLEGRSWMVLNWIKGVFFLITSPPTKPKTNKKTSPSIENAIFTFFRKKNHTLGLQCPLIWVQIFMEPWNSLIHENLRPLLTGIVDISKLCVGVAEKTQASRIICNGCGVCVNSRGLAGGWGGGWWMRTTSLAGSIFLFEKDVVPQCHIYCFAWICLSTYAMCWETKPQHAGLPAGHSPPGVLSKRGGDVCPQLVRLLPWLWPRSFPSSAF